MKKLLFVLFIFTILAELHAQNDKKYMLRADFGYYYIHKDQIDAGGGYHNDIFGEIDNNLNCKFSVGRKLKTNFYYGLGFSYRLARAEINPKEDIPEMDASTGHSNLTIIVNTVNTNETYSPLVFLQYFFPVTERFQFVLDLYSRFDLALSKSESSYGTFELNRYSKQQFLSCGINPLFRVNIIRNIGMELALGTIELKHKIHDSRASQNDKNSTEFILAFTPENWLIGFYLAL